MSGGPGVCLAGWSDAFSSWVSIAVSRDRKSVEHLAGRLVMLGLVIRFFRLRPWMMRTGGGGAREREAVVGAFVAHDVGDPNA